MKKDQKDEDLFDENLVPKQQHDLAMDANDDRHQSLRLQPLAASVTLATSTPLPSMTSPRKSSRRNALQSMMLVDVPPSYISPDRHLLLSPRRKLRRGKAFSHHSTYCSTIIPQIFQHTREEGMAAPMWTAKEDEELETALSGLKDLPEDEPMRWELAVGLVGRGRTVEDLKLRYGQLQEDLIRKNSGLHPLYAAGTAAAVTGAAARTTPCASPATSSGSSSDFDQATIFSQFRKGNSKAVTFIPHLPSNSGSSSKSDEEDSIPPADGHSEAAPDYKNHKSDGDN